MSGTDAQKLLESSREAAVNAKLEQSWVEVEACSVAFVTAVVEVVTALLADVRDLFYLVDGSNLRPRLRPHPALSAPTPSAPEIEADARQKALGTKSSSNPRFQGLLSPPPSSPSPFLC